MPDPGVQPPRRRRTFAELEQSGGKRCARCGEPGSHVLRIAVTEPQVGRTPMPSIAKARGSVCEACAVDVFEVVAKAVKG